MQFSHLHYEWNLSQNCTPTHAITKDYFVEVKIFRFTFMPSSGFPAALLTRARHAV